MYRVTNINAFLIGIVVYYCNHYISEVTLKFTSFVHSLCLQAVTPSSESQFRGRDT